MMLRKSKSEQQGPSRSVALKTLGYTIFQYRITCSRAPKLFPRLGFVNSAAVSMGVHIYSEVVILFPSNVYPEVELLNHMVVLFLIL